MKKVFLRLIFGLLIVTSSWQVAWAQELLRVPIIIHMSTTLSDGTYSLQDIINLARKHKIKAIIITDRDLRVWEYGLWPLRRIIRRAMIENSILRYGVERYLKQIEAAQRANPDILLIPGVESGVHYYWLGKFYEDPFRLKNWHKHMIMIGLEKPEDFKNLPIVGNIGGLMQPFKFKNILYFWPIILIVLGILCFLKKHSYTDASGRNIGRPSWGIKIIGILLCLIGIVFLVNNYPYRDLKFDQYTTKPGIKPYQNYIDYANKIGALVFWVHPEAENIEKRGNISIETRDYSGDLLESHDYTGFSVFNDGYNRVGCIGCIWDTVLKQYCKGTRAQPVWTFAGLGFDRGNLDARIAQLRTIVLVKHIEKIEILNALREGRMYAVNGKQTIKLYNFTIKDPVSGKEGISGQVVNAKGPAIVKISGAFTDGEAKAKIKLIRYGKLMQTFEVSNNFDIEFQDTYYRPGIKTYYRIEIHYPGGILITNPIFVQFKNSF